MLSPRQALIYVALVALGSGVGWGIVQWMKPSPPEGRTPGDVLVPRPGEMPVLKVALESNGRTLLEGGGRIALPKDTRFSVRVEADRDGTVELHGVNPQGRATSAPIWQQALKRGERVLSPSLKAEGQGGSETLRVVFKPAGAGFANEESFIIWHP